MRIIILLFFLVNATFNSFGQQTMGLFQNDSTSFNGYTLIASLSSTETFLIDNCGFIVHQWSNSTHRPGASVYLLEDGSLMRTCRLGNGVGGRIEHYDWDDNLMWSYNILDSTQEQHHDIEVLPNGNILVLAYDIRSNAAALAAGRDPNTLLGELWSEKVVELQPIGTDSAVVVWEWYLWDHLIQDLQAGSNFGVVNQHPELVNINYDTDGSMGIDWIHANSIDYNEDWDQIIISARRFNEIWIIDHSTTTAEAASHTGGQYGKGGDLLYRWGNPTAYQIGEEGSQVFFGQHDAQWIPSSYRDGGKIMVYNNGRGSSNSISQVQIITPPINANGNYFYQADSMYLPHVVDWSYTTPSYSNFVSGAQRLENGNTLICNGPSGNVIEIDTFDNLVWDYVNPVGINGIIGTQGTPPSNNTLFRAYKYSPFYPAFTGRTLTPTTPIELNPLPSNCVVYFPVDTEPQWQTLDIQVIQNPIQDILRIENSMQNNIQLKVIDILGRIVLEDYGQATLLEYQVQHWAKGSYFIIAIDEENNTLYRQQVIKN